MGGILMAVDPRYFQFGNAFLGGMEQAGEDRRRNALLDIEQGQFGLQQRRQALGEHEYARSVAAEQAAAKQSQEALERRAQVLSQVLPEQYRPMAREIAAELDDDFVSELLAKQME